MLVKGRGTTQGVGISGGVRPDMVGAVCWGSLTLGAVHTDAMDEGQVHMGHLAHEAGCLIEGLWGHQVRWLHTRPLPQPQLHSLTRAMSW